MKIVKIIALAAFAFGSVALSSCCGSEPEPAPAPAPIVEIPAK